MVAMGSMNISGKSGRKKLQGTVNKVSATDVFLVNDQSTSETQCTGQDGEGNDRNEPAEESDDET